MSPFTLALLLAACNGLGAQSSDGSASTTGSSSTSESESTSGAGSESETAGLACADDPIASLEDTAKVSLLERLEAMARAEDPRVAQVMAHVAGSWEVVMVARSAEPQPTL